MFVKDKTRFKSPEDALRFYFRLRELLNSGPLSRPLAGELPTVASSSAANAIDDYQRIGWCMHGLDEIDLWLLGEVYGPTCFGIHRRTFSLACKAARLEFPNREFHVRQIGLIHRHAIGVVSRGLHDLGMTPLRQVMPATEISRRLRTGEKRAHVNGNRTALQ